MPRCFFRASGPCDGPPTRAHLIPQCVIREAMGGVVAIPCPTCGADSFAPCRGPRRGKVHETRGRGGRAWRRLTFDSRSWVWACSSHHDGFDRLLTVWVRRDELPLALESFAYAHGLTPWLDAVYGPRAWAGVA
jgi:hypothetical protein